MTLRSQHTYTAVPTGVIPVPTASPPTLAPLVNAGTASAAAAVASSATWDTLRRQARQLENDIDGKLVQYSRIGNGTPASVSSYAGASRIGTPAHGFPGANAIELELEDLLKKLTSVVNQMSNCLDNMANSMAPNPSMMHHLQRHRDILFDYSKDFRKTKAHITAMQDHAQLLGSVRHDVNSYKSGVNTQDYLLSERGRIDGTHHMADEILDNAYAMRADLHDQRGFLRQARGRMTGVLAQFPLVNNLISKINTRRRRDSLIMAGVISFCTCFLLWYFLSRFI
ncbi:Golgi SNAP receptor complex member 1 [Gaertneriomyces sp. JEL0708]|nr:Golgi SNAP receptor complex member 1 [Gaertneriomyces sp. JEL0708]